MDCDQVGELLDAYALGAAEADEAAALEEHVADCVRCWSSSMKPSRQQPPSPSPPPSSALPHHSATASSPRPNEESVSAYRTSCSLCAGSGRSAPAS